MPAVGCFSSPLPLLGATRFWPGPGAGREASGAEGGWTAAVVWGSEVLTIRADHVVLEHAFYDQDGELFKTLQSLEIGEAGGRTIAKRQRMQKTDAVDEWTEIAVLEVEYDLELRDSLFTLSNLRNPRN